jgi:allantoin racemase
MRLLVVNVNTTESMTATIGERARRFAAPGTEIIPLTPTFGPDSCESNLDSHLAAIAVADRVLAYEGSYDAVVQAGFGEHGREVLQEVLDVPVVDITEAAAHLACLLGRRYSVITTLERSISLIEDRLLLAGLDRTCASVLSSGIEVLGLAEDRDRTLAAIVEQALTAIRRDRAEVICVGCAGMADLAEEIQAAVGVPVVDGVSAAVKLAESLVALGLSTSKSLTYATSRPKAYRGWPLSVAATGA